MEAIENTPQPLKILDSSPILQPAITLHNPQGKTARIDFSGDEVAYSGDLPVSEAARIFFDAVFGYKVASRPAIDR